MSNRDIVLEMANRLPAETPLRDFARELEFIAGVREGFEQLDRGEGVPIEQVEQLVASWTTK